ncbi:hypothetical protein CCP3SC15_1210002 [Gammaproteobacteria bacterium]
MKTDNPFDKAIKVRQIPDSMRDAAIYITDSLDLAWDSVRAVFEEQAKPEHALKILELFLSEEKSAFIESGSRVVRRPRNDT